MTIRIPDDVKAAFDKAFEGEDKDVAMTAIIREALDKRERRSAAVNASTERSRAAVDAILELRRQAPFFTDAQIRQAREDGRP
jgi:hypothetical protein